MKIKLAFLQAAVQLPGVFATETTLSTDKVPGIKMEWDPKGLLIEVKGQKAVVPQTNVKIAFLEEEPIKSK